VRHLHPKGEEEVKRTRGADPNYLGPNMSSRPLRPADEQRRDDARAQMRELIATRQSAVFAGVKSELEASA
jgi:hypothetical protein